MSARLYVGSLGFSVTDEELSEFFAQAGTVVSAKVIIDREMNRSKGFGFVEMSSDEEAQAAITQLSGQELGGRQIVVNIAKPMTERPNNGPSTRYGSRY
jgi:RNA recognition motif-containing protein